VFASVVSERLGGVESSGIGGGRFLLLALGLVAIPAVVYFFVKRSSPTPPPPSSTYDNDAFG